MDVVGVLAQGVVAGFAVEGAAGDAAGVERDDGVVLGQQRPDRGEAGGVGGAAGDQQQDGAAAGDVVGDAGAGYGEGAGGHGVSSDRGSPTRRMGSAGTDTVSEILRVR